METMKGLARVKYEEVLDVGGKMGGKTRSFLFKNGGKNGRK
jgi:hypothetical protein